MIKQTTLDILDSSLRKKNTDYLTRDYIDRFQTYHHNIRIDPSHSEDKYEEIDGDNLALNWVEFKYSDLPDLSKIINKDLIGIYYFSVRPSKRISNLPQYIMYVGISGEHGSKRPLRERITDYYYISKLKKRSNVHQFLQMYYENVYISFSYYKGDHKDLEKIETFLHEFFAPKFNLRDFEPKTKKAIKAWGY